MTTMTTMAMTMAMGNKACVVSSVVPRGRASSRGGSRGRRTTLFKVRALLGDDGGSGSGSGSAADELLRRGRATYEAGERMNGYKMFEKALGMDDASLETRRELCYCAMCCNAAFGDVETAKMYLREMQAYGLDFEDALVSGGRMKMESSALMKNQLKKFAAGEGKSFGTVQREAYERDKAASAPATPPTSVRGLADLDISSDTDESVEAIVKRVGLLLVVSAAGFAALFAGGMGIMQPGSLPFGY